MPKTESEIRAVHTIMGESFRHRLKSMWLSTPKEIVVWTPPGYNDPANHEKRYGTLYMLDGQNVLDGATAFIAGKEWRADETAADLINKKQIDPIVIVTIANAGVERANEYLPTRDPAWQGGQGGLASNFVSFLSDELKPFIEGNYRVAVGSKQTGICGSSFGGICALWVALQRPNTFAKAAIMSPSVWWNDRVTLQIVRKYDPYFAPPLLWLDTGTDEGDGNTAQSATTVKNAQDLRDALAMKGWKLGRTLMYTEAAGDKHNEDAWARRFPDVLRFLFPYNKK